MRAEDLIGRVLAQNFRIEHLLGKSGAVYCARQLSVDRDVVLRILRSEQVSDPEILTRFKREATLLGRLNHQNIARVIDCGECDRDLVRHDIGAYVAMELPFRRRPRRLAATKRPTDVPAGVSWRSK